ncbi:MAG TPA: type II toxin-antitoxin system Phd/YefM family antitoxin [Bradyrhizobium sp.]|nr:type II toxin-antitoxin system Phd/YefM family antitoxin [Bradyrhizobium sp.]
MKHIKSSDAKARFSELLDEVERGETLIITRHGKPIANLQPPDDVRRARARRAMEEVAAARKTAPRVTVEEILQWHDEGRRF